MCLILRDNPLLPIGPTHDGLGPFGHVLGVDEGLTLVLLPPHTQPAVGRIQEDGPDGGMGPSNRAAVTIPTGVVGGG